MMPNLISQIQDVDIENLRESGIGDRTIRDNQLTTGARGPGRKIHGLVFPYRGLNGEMNGFFRVRLHEPFSVQNGKLIRYWQPKGSSVRAYFPTASLKRIKDGEWPIFITEGEKKALALSQLGFAVVGIGGINSWHVKRDKKSLVDDLTKIDWKGRDVFIVFDYDSKPATRREVETQAKELANALSRKGAKTVSNVKLPAGHLGSKQGVDDFLVSKGKRRLTEFRKLVNNANSLSVSETGKVYTMADAEEFISEIEYLIPEWIPRGMITGVVAEPGVGKSAFALHCIARPIATNENWFSGEERSGKTGKVLWCDTENSLAITMGRIKSWGIPADKIVLPFNPSEPPVDLTNDSHIARIETLVKDQGIEAVIIDSLRGSHDGDENNSRVGRILQHLGGIAERTGCAMIVIHHTRKLRIDEEITANSSRGSNAILAMMRCQIGIDRPDANSKWCRVQVLKENLGLSPKPLGFRITDDGIEFGDPPQQPRTHTQKDNAEQWLRSRLKPGKAYKASEIIEEGNQHGHAVRTLRKAATERLGIRPKQIRKGGKITGWSWALPET